MKLPNKKQSLIGSIVIIGMFAVSAIFTHTYLQLSGFSEILITEDTAQESEDQDVTSKNKKLSDFINYNLAMLVGTCAGVGALGSMVTIFIGTAGLFEDEIKKPEVRKEFVIVQDNEFLFSTTISKQLEGIEAFKCLRYFAEVHIRLQSYGCFVNSNAKDMAAADYFDFNHLFNRFPIEALEWIFLGPNSFMDQDDSTRFEIRLIIKVLTDNFDSISKYEILVFYHKILAKFGIFGNIINLISLIEQSLIIELEVKNRSLISIFSVQSLHDHKLITKPVNSSQELNNRILGIYSEFIPNDSRKEDMKGFCESLPDCDVDNYGILIDTLTTRFQEIAQNG